MSLRRTWHLLAISIALLGCRESKTAAVEQSNSTPNVTRLTAVDLDRHIASLKGKVVLVNFWATWCGPCRTEIPDFIKLQNQYGPEGLQIVGLSIDTVPTEKVTKFVRDRRINYSIFVVGQDAMNKWGSFEAIPMTFLLDTQGKKVWEIEGSASAETFEKQIKPLLSK